MDIAIVIALVVLFLAGVALAWRTARRPVRGGFVASLPSTPIDKVDRTEYDRLTNRGAF